MRDIFAMKIAHTLTDLRKKPSNLSHNKISFLEEVKKTSMYCILDDQDIFWSLSLFIAMCTIKRNPLNILERFDHIFMIKILQYRVFIMKMPAFSPAGNIHHLQHNTLLLVSIQINFRMGSLIEFFQISG